MTVFKHISSPPLTLSRSTHSLARTIVADYQRKRGIEVDGLAAGIIEGPYATYDVSSSLTGKRDVFSYPWMASCSILAVAESAECALMNMADAGN